MWGGCGGGGLSRSVVSDLTLCNSLDCSPPGIFFRQEYWSGLPFPTPGDLSNPGIEPGSPMSPALQVDSLSTEPLGKSKGEMEVSKV